MKISKHSAPQLRRQLLATQRKSKCQSKNKYGVGIDEVGKIKRRCDGVLFDSIKEKDRYVVLSLLQKNGDISNLELQKKFSISINGIQICNYVADFVYLDADGNFVVEDVKGFRTKEYILKRKMFEAYYKIIITEI